MSIVLEDKGEAYPNADGSHCRTRTFWILLFLTHRAAYLTMEWIVMEGSSIDAEAWKMARLANLYVRFGTGGSRSEAGEWAGVSACVSAVAPNPGREP